MNENGLLAIYIAFLLVSGITTGTAMDDYWGRAENDGYIGIIALTGMAFVVAVLAGMAETGRGKNGCPVIFSVSLRYVAFL